MRLAIFTICLDAIRFLPAQFYTFNRLGLDWHWYVCEGAAANVNCTSWCKPQMPRYSTDGTSNFLNSIRNHPRVTVIQRQWWEGGKVQMCNACVDQIKEPCVLLECDADEFYLRGLGSISRMFDYPFVGGNHKNCARFFSRYFVGPNIVTIGEDCYGNNSGEFMRCWKFAPGMRFSRHEPPVLEGINGPHERAVSRDTTRHMGIVMDHYAYVYPEQVEYKEKFYGYKDALAHWTRLQNHPGPWPVKLRDFLPWVDDRAQADLLHR